MRFQDKNTARWMEEGRRERGRREEKTERGEKGRVRGCD